MRFWERLPDTSGRWIISIQTRYSFISFTALRPWHETVSLCAHTAGTYVISRPTGKGWRETWKGDGRLRHCGDALSTSSSLIACTVRFASRSPWKPAEKPIDSLFGDSSERELFQESLGPFSAPLLSTAESLPRLRRERDRERRGLFHFRRSVSRGRKRARGDEERTRERREAREAERGGVVKRGLFR